MKRITLLLLIALSNLALFAQGPPPSFMYCLNRPEIQSEDVVLVAGNNPEIEENVKWALNKYWGKPANIKTIANSASARQKCSYITVNDYETDGEDGHFLNTHFRVTNEMKSQDPNVIFDLPFDNFIVAKNPKTVVGSDKNLNLLADKALVYTMLFCSVTKHFSNDFGNFRKAMKAYDDYIEKAREKLKTTTVLVPKELMDNGFTNEVFNGIDVKYQVLPSADIAKKIKDGTDLKNYSALFVYKQDKFQDNGYLVDLENGDLISRAYLGGSIASKTYDYMDAKRLHKLLEKLLKP